METIRKCIQWFWLLLTNSYVAFPFSGNLYQGPLKVLCAPGLNCYSCPAAVAYCPLGSLQQLLLSLRMNLEAGYYFFGSYVVGASAMLATVFGRFLCGWACPFGLFQELLYRLPSPKASIPPVLRWGKYLALFLFVLVLPLAVIDDFGLGRPWFCKYLCPAGTVEAGLPMLLLLPDLRAAIGLLFWSKFAVLLLFTGWSITSSRPFCRTLCPLGAFYGMFSRVSLIRLRLVEENCTRCGACHTVCPVEIRFNETPGSSECINCLKCMTEACSFNAISIDVAGYGLYRRNDRLPT